MKTPAIYCNLSRYFFYVVEIILIYFNIINYYIYVSGNIHYFRSCCGMKSILARQNSKIKIVYNTRYCNHFIFYTYYRYNKYTLLWSQNVYLIVLMQY